MMATTSRAPAATERDKDCHVTVFTNSIIDGRSHSKRRITFCSPRFILSAAVVQFQKQGKDMEKVKQRLAEIANYVDKVTIKSPEGMKCRNGICSGKRSILRMS